MLQMQRMFGEACGKKVTEIANQRMYREKSTSPCLVRRFSRLAAHDATRRVPQANRRLLFLCKLQRCYQALRRPRTNSASRLATARMAISPRASRGHDGHTRPLPHAHSSRQRAFVIVTSDKKVQRRTRPRGADQKGRSSGPNDALHALFTGNGTTPDRNPLKPHRDNCSAGAPTPLGVVGRSSGPERAPSLPMQRRRKLA
jgi:hypothetical protein